MSNTAPHSQSFASSEFDPDSIDRALAFHNCAEPEPVAGPPHPERCEELLVRASSVIDTAAATAYENADSLTGSQRKVAMGVVCLIEQVQQLLDRLLDEKPTH